MRTLFALFCFLLVSAPLSATQSDTAWVRVYGGTAPDILLDMALDQFGASYVTGYVWGGSSLDDIVTIKYLPNGDTAWVRTYNGSANGFDRGNGITVDESGNVYVCGMSDTTSSIADWIVLKYSPEGQLEWRDRLGVLNLREEAQSVTLDDSGFVYVTGVKLTVAAGYDILTVKYSPDGDILWQDQYDGEFHSSENCRNIVFDGENSVIVCGLTHSASGFPIYLALKYTNTGTRQWDRTYDSPDPIDVSLRVGVDAARNVYVSGYNQPSSGIQIGITTIKYSPTGDTLWTKIYDDPFEAEDYFSDLVVDSIGNAYVAGNTNGGFLGQQLTVIKYDPNGDTAWVRTIPGAQTQGSDARAVAVDGAGRVYVTGFINQPTPNDYDLIAASYNSDGSLRWIETFSGPGANPDVGTEIAVDQTGNVLVAGSFDGGNSTFEDYLLIKYLQYECGDADGSGLITISDAVFLINFIFSGGPMPNPLSSGDADCSGNVNISDAVYLINYIFSGGPAPCAACA